MPLFRTLLDGLNAAIVTLLCRVDDEQISRVPDRGPLVVITNHVNMLELLVLRSRLRDRTIFTFAKAESWANPITGRILDAWDAIPIRRGETDLVALRRGLAVLKQGGILGIMPEGTRSHDGRLQRGRTGITTIALKSGAPLLPVVFYGGEAIAENVRRLRRTPFHIVVGAPLRIDLQGERPTREIRRAITDEIMREMARLLPERYRGVYADVDARPRYVHPATTT
jgi:1-acyl-sn-glycerol-3-phosphate acyltransferase